MQRQLMRLQSHRKRTAHFSAEHHAGASSTKKTTTTRVFGRTRRCKTQTTGTAFLVLQPPANDRRLGTGRRFPPPLRHVWGEDLGEVGRRRQSQEGGGNAEFFVMSSSLGDGIPREQFRVDCLNLPTFLLLPLLEELPR